MIISSMDTDMFKDFSAYDEYQIGEHLFKVYKNPDVDALCEKSKILNICIIDNLGNKKYLTHKSDIDNSPVTEIIEKDKTIGLYHWRGFLTRIDKRSLDFVDQSFTK